MQQQSNQIGFHKLWLGIIKKAVKDSTYVGFENYKDNYFIKIKVKDGKEMVLQLAGKPSDLTTESYQKIIAEITKTE